MHDDEHRPAAIRARADVRNHIGKLLVSRPVAVLPFRLDHEPVWKLSKVMHDKIGADPVLVDRHAERDLATELARMAPE